MNEISISKEIEYLLQFAEQQSMIEKLDIIPCRNALLDLFNLNEPYIGGITEKYLKNPIEIIKELLDYGYKIGLIPENTIMYRDLLDAKIMGILMPRQSEVAKNFWNTAKDEGIKKATDKFYALSKASNYIKTDRIAKNLYWRSNTDYGELEITINLSKPEKDPRDIAAAKLRAQSNYPKCLLCIENVGYAGHEGHPARQNHRVIPITVAQEQWYMQYSPYLYYKEHCILLKDEHVPMKISYKTFKRLVDFIEQIPHYFIGSNTDIPIVGGSILSHEHFQGGQHVFPMEEAKIDINFKYKEFSDVNIGIVKWPMSVIRLSSLNKNQLISLSSRILDNWKEYSDLEAEIVPFSVEEGIKVYHNAITPIARKNNNNEFEIDLVLRNNRVTKEYPYGIFHPHEELHHIKKENIGLIEVMGLAVLPARLNEEIYEIKRILTGEMSYTSDEIDEKNPLYKHNKWICELLKKYGAKCSLEEADEYIKKEVGIKFLEVLLDAGVYKRNKKGQNQFINFMAHMGFEIL
ncbi:galactose-1-phosphate uridylyltransferase [Clostridium botulinum]|uniref:Galactose-1-phosphate uridylyltransferase n=1 Tax=Clostridium botulinum C/D str. DC5 TaxID=1443128 RepID=A0A0A0IGM2_CLOBO|nr:UDP-glucose--hexose-1-phosphate uridylyltransferase [Clostridium botulinum]KEI06125.1 galactose-1-phosphate uridylyltransferase [Clostridium botulinum C/D str. BKT75002]KEI08109.1 galactose-1-phosphate uridylyltransferase [Clostridium botulinum C/D str. BKT2873]KGM94620.1 galactose-1-phosphate uridylyltransferase [Clostridium botulinum D str. CCUG 7971]KGM99703.1 galactose-1-phosphate uridylyltransferase [Clostridium botulinum C/D str. DC5]KOC50232.1 galactose-1-phosphate uridylyltransferas